MNSDKLEIRPIPISQIKNNTARRILIIVMFIPIVLIGWIIHKEGDICTIEAGKSE